MSVFKHDSDLPTYRGLGTRSSVKDRQRIAQLFLAKSCEDNVCFDKILQQNLNLSSLSQKFKRFDVLFPRNFSELVNIIKKG